ncbi:MAG: Gfo/Idh/MocA family protein [Planctomycetota bacterium]|jgi:predicted dehydrogenase
MLQKGKINRRQFLGKAAAVAAGAIAFPYIVPSSALGKGGRIAPSSRIVMGCIGMGTQGTGNMRAFLGQEDVQVAAVCDVRESQLQKAKNIVDRHYGDKGCTTYNDFRELIARKDIDAVSIAPPDHWHVLIGLEAARNGKDMYFEKPVGLSVTHSKALRDAVNRYGVVFQFGTQQRSSNNFRFGCELVRNGRIGKLHTILVGVPPGISYPNQPTQPVPDGFDYDMWLGPAPWAPYTYQRCRPFDSNENVNWGYGIWYHIYDYCLGMPANWGVHHLDIAQWGNGTENSGPVEVEGTGVFPRDGLANCLLTWDVRMKYANGVTMRYADNAKIKQGIKFEGTDGWVFVRRGNYIETQPKSLLKSVISPNEIHLVKSKGHHRNFLDAVRTRGKTICPIEGAVRSDTLCHLNDIATRLERKLRWNPQKEQFVNDSEANRMLKRSMRSPWHL